MNLYVSGVCEISSLAVTLHGSRTVAAHGVGRKEIRITVTSGSDNYGMGGKTLQFTGHQVAGDNTACTAVHHHQIHHLVTGEQFHRTGIHLTAQSRISTEQQLLSGLSFGVERTGYLCATERTVGQHASVFAGKRNTLCHTLVDDVVGNLGQAVHIGFTGTVVATLHRIVEQTVNGVTVVLVILGRIDTSLCGDGVCAARRILNTEIKYFESHLAERSCGRGTGQTGTDHDDVQTALVGRIHQFLMCLIIGPFLSYRSFRNLGIDYLCHSSFQFNDSLINISSTRFRCNRRRKRNTMPLPRTSG